MEIEVFIMPVVSRVLELGDYYLPNMGAMDEKKSPASNKQATVMGLIIRVHLLEFISRE
jgi:hypothetical protein